MKLRTLLVFALFVSMSLIAYAQSGPAGKWTGETQGRGGPQTVTLDLAVKGSDLTGSFTQGENKTDISEGKVVDAGTITFKRSIAGRGGGEPIVLTYTGKISGDELTLTVEAPAGGGGGGGGGRGGGGRGGGGPLTLKRAK